MVLSKAINSMIMPPERNRKTLSKIGNNLATVLEEGRFPDMIVYVD